MRSVEQSSAADQILKNVESISAVTAETASGTAAGCAGGGRSESTDDTAGRAYVQVDTDKEDRGHDTRRAELGYFK